MEEESISFINGYIELKKYREGEKFYKGKDARKVIINRAILTGLNLLFYSFPVTYGVLSFTHSKQLDYTDLVLYPTLIGTAVLFNCITHFANEEVESRVNKKAFKEKYPDVDMNISDDVLDLILDNDLEEDIVDIKNDSIVNLEEFNKQDNSTKIKILRDRIDCLEELKDFYEVQLKKEKYYENNKTKKLIKE